MFFFFFQSEDGIRDLIVTGVQTCALPISPERDLLQALLEPVVNAYPKRAAKGPVRENLDLAECWSLMHSLCFTALRQEGAFLDLPDACWNWARFFILLTH